MTRYAADTSVTSETRRAEIERILRRYNASSFAYGWDDTSASVMFDMGGRRIRFKIPLPDRFSREFTHTPERGRPRSKEAAARAFEQAVRQRWAALSLVIKAKLEAIEAGISTLDQEFGMAMVLPGGKTVGEMVIPQLDAAYAGSPLPALLPGGAQ